MIESLLLRLGDGPIPAFCATVLLALVLVLRHLRGEGRQPRSVPPAPAADPPPERRSSQPGPPPSRRAARRVLVVDDDPSISRIIVRFLESDLPQLEVETADTAEEALERCRAVPFDLLVVDLGLPDVGGAELIRRVREEGTLRPMVHVVVLSGMPAEVIEEVGRSAGASAWLAKGDYPALVRVVARLLRFTLPG